MVAVGAVSVCQRGGAGGFALRAGVARATAGSITATSAAVARRIASIVGSTRLQSERDGERRVRRVAIAVVGDRELPGAHLTVDACVDPGRDTRGRVGADRSVRVDGEFDRDL